MLDVQALDGKLMRHLSSLLNKSLSLNYCNQVILRRVGSVRDLMSPMSIGLKLSNQLSSGLPTALIATSNVAPRANQLME